MTFLPPLSILSSAEMPYRSSHAKTAPAKLTFVVLSDPDKPSRTFEASKVTLGVIVLLGFVVVGAISVILMVYTPVGKVFFPNFFSTQEEQLEKVRVLESKVDAVQNELTYLTAYNEKLREVLGDTLKPDTTGVAAAQEATQPVPEEENAAPSEPVSRPAATVQNAAVIRPVDVSEDASSFFPLLMPVSGFISRGVDYAIEHYGIDIAAPLGEPIVAPAPGEVIFSDWTLTGGNTLVIAHPGDFLTVYKHCERILVSVGTNVTRGEAIALVGSTGTTSTGPHLHFELWHNGKNLNPENYLLKMK